ncbi:MAG TPA: octanoyltransferase [Legionella sp.]|nr:octanoyltransferase [Legionella sp.]
MVTVRHLGTQAYNAVWADMKRFTVERDIHTLDELWLLQHPAVYTQGQAGKPEHILQNTQDIPIIQADRGGQVTYHGPGQLIGYTLMNISRRDLGIRTFVCQLERILIDVLGHFRIVASTRAGAPGVYVGNKKIASIGLRVKNGCTYHGIALNVAMDLTPFSNINPCGLAQLQMTQIQNYVPKVTIEEVEAQFITHFISLFGC